VAAQFTESGRVEISYNNSGRLEPIGELVGQEAIAAAVSQMMRMVGATIQPMTTLLK
jgi:hypothetical protein